MYRSLLGKVGLVLRVSNSRDWLEALAVDMTRSYEVVG